MATIIQTINGKVTGLWGSALRRTPSGKLVALKMGDEVRQGDVILTTQDGLVEISPDTKLPRAAAVAETDIDRVIAGLNEPDERTAPAAGLNGGDGSGLQPGLRVGRISEGLDPSLTLTPANESASERVTEVGPSSPERLAQLASEQAGGVPATPPAPAPAPSPAPSPAPAPAPNSQPAASASSATGAEDSTLPIPLAGQDADGSIASVRITALPSNGTVLMADGVTPVTVGQVLTPAQAAGLLFSPSPDFNGGNVLTFVVVDNEGSTSAPASVQINVTAVNDAPVAHADSAVATEDTVLHGNVLANDNDVDGPALAVTQFSINGATHAAGTTAVLASGSLVIHADGSFVFTPAANYNGPVPTATYTVSDGNLASTSTLSISVGAVNDAPIAGDDVFVTPINTPATITVLANDSDPDGDPLSVSNPVLGNPALGSVSVNASGQLVFTPAANVTGPVTITYTVSDPSGASDTATVTVNVGANTPPTGANAVLTLGEDTSVNLQPSDFGFSDADAGQAFAGVRIDTIPAAGSLLLNGVPVSSGSVVSAADIASGALVYSPAPNGNGAPYAGLSFSVQDTAGSFDTSPNTLTFNVTPVADAAAIGGQTSGATTEDTALTTSGSLTVTDPDAGEAAFVAQTGVAGAHGIFSIDASGAWTYTLNNTDPAVQALGLGQTLPSETFTVATIDGTTQVITVTITGTDDAPVISSGSGTVVEDTQPSVSGTLTATDVDNPALAFVPAALNGNYGSLTLQANGQWTYTLDARADALAQNQAANDAFTVTLNDGSTTTVTVGITGTNDAAVITGTATGSVTEDGTVTASGTLSATDVDSAAGFTAASATGTYGNFAINAAGAWTYTLRNGDANVQALTSNQHPTETFTVTTADGTSRQITVTVNGANEAPTAAITAASGNEDNSIPVTLAGSDVDGSLASFTVTDLPANGTLYYNGTAVTVGASIPATAGSAALSFVPNANWNGSTSISFSATDAEGASSPAVSQSITVAAVNDAPVASDDIASTPINTALSSINVLGNDSDVEGDTLSVTAASLDNPSQGTLSINPDGTLAFTPAANVAGPVLIHYTVADPSGATSTAQLTVNVGSNTPPTGTDTTVTLNEDSTRSFSAADFGFSDADAGQSFAAVRIDTLPTAGSLTYGGAPVAAGQLIPAAGLASLVFTPAPDANGTGYASFSFSVQDNAGAFDTAPNTVTLNLTPVNDAPVAVDDHYTINEDQPLAISLPALVANDTDADGDALAVFSASNIQHGTLAYVGGVLTFTPDANYSGPASFTYGVHDGHGGVSFGTVQITVNPVDDPSVLVADTATIAEDSGTATGNVLGNDTDVDNALTVAGFSIAGLPGSYLPGQAVAIVNVGTFTLGADGAYSFTPLANWNGAVPVVTYTTNTGASSTLNIDVTPVNDAPVAVDDHYTINEDQPLAISLPALVANDIDIDGDALAVFSASNVQHGTLSYVGGVLTFTPDANYNGPASFTYGVHDGHGGVSFATVNITVNPVNDPATIGGDDSGAVTEDVAVLAGQLSDSGTLSVSDVDAGEAAFNAGPAAPVGSTLGALSITAGGAWTYTVDNADVQYLAAGQTRTESFTVSSIDGSTHVITVTITGTNDAAVITGTATGSVTEDGTATTSGVLSATDVDSAATFNAASAAGTYGNFSIDATGNWIYTLRNGDANVQALTSSQHPTETFTVTTADGTSQTITVTVNGANEAPIATITPASGNEDTSIPVTLTGSDVDGAIASFTVTALPTNGTLYYNGSTVAIGASIPATAGSAALSFVPNANWNGSTSLSFSATDAEGASSPAVSQGITINAVNDAPVAGDDVASTAINTPVTIDVLANDSDVDGDTLTVSNPVLANPAQGTVSVNASGQLVFTPASNFSGPVTITYSVTDPAGLSDTATLTVNVGTNTPPTGTDATRTLAEDTSYTVQAGDFGFADTDLGQTFAGVRIDTPPAAGSLLLNGVAVAAGQVVSAAEIAAGHLVFVPAANANGSNYANLQFSVQDSAGSFDTAPNALSFNVTPVADAAVITAGTGSVTEDTAVNGAGNLSTGGTLALVDPDAGEAAFQPQAAAPGAYGSFTLAADGSWTYTAANSNPAIQALAAGQTLTDTLTVSSVDGTASTITVTIVGTNDAAVITPATVTLTETNAILTTGGTLAITDIDSPATFVAQSNVAGSAGYGHFNLAANGAWTYVTDTAHNEFAAGTTYTDTLTVTSADGTASTITVHIVGTNDAAVIVPAVANLTETDTVLTTGGTLAISDVDSPATFVAQSNVAGSAGYGHFNLAADGTWSYTTDTAHNEFAAGTTYTDTLTVTSADGTASTVTVHIVGTNDAAVIVPATVNLTETNAILTTGGTLAISDVDSPATFVAQSNVAGSAGYGHFSLAADGTWTYTTDTAHNEFVAGTTYTDTLTVTSADGTTSTITVHIAGTNDAAVITGTSAGSVTEDGTLVSSGTLSATDADSPAGFTAATASGTYGNFTINAAGAWTYTLRNGDANVQALTSSQHPTETFTVTTADGSTQQITVTVNGANEAPTATITPASGNEDTAIPVTLTGSDVDGTIASFTVTALPANGTLYYNGTPVTVGASIPATAGSAALSFVPNANWNGNTSISFSATDAEGASSPAVTQSITVAAVNDAPVAGDDAAFTAINTPVTINVLANDTDVDGDTLTVSNPVLANPAQGTVSLDAGGHLVFTPASNFSGPVSITYTVTDPSGATDTATVVVNVGANTPPAGADASRSFAEDSSYTVQTGDFGFADADAGQTLLNVRIDTLPGAGSLLLNGVAVTAGQVVAASEIAAGHLVFVPAANANGAPYAALSFSVQDNAGSFDTAPNTLSFNVTPVADAAVITAGLGSVTEDTAVNGAGNLSTGGTLGIVDPDAGEAAFQPQTTFGTYGSFVLAADGTWSYAAANANPAIQALTSGQSLTETFTVHSVDGTPSTVTVTLRGTDDAATISGNALGNVVEAGGNANGAPGTSGATGTLSVSDADAGQSGFQAPGAGSLNGTYGTFTFNAASGAWTYVLDNTRPATQALNAGEQVHDTLTVQSLDGSASRVIDVTVNGSNDNASIGGTALGTVTEAGGISNGSAGTPTASGTLNVSDVDAGQAAFQAPAAGSLNGTYGTFTFNAATGAWTYALDNTRAATQGLNAGDVAHETLTVTSLDGTATQVIDVTVNGTNDNATITGTALGSVTEAGGLNNAAGGTPTASGTLSVADVDAGQAAFQAPASLAGTYGTFTFNAGTGAWTYALDNTRAATQQLTAGQQVHDTLSVQSLDGSASQIIDVTVTGSNDTAVIGGTAIGSVTEAGGVNNGSTGTPTASGTLNVTDVDAGQAGFQAPSAGSLNGTYGTFTFNAATGAWTYALDNTRGATQSLTAGQVAHDTLTIASSDGSATQVIDVTVNGSNDNATISGTATGSVTEAGGLNNATSGAPTASGSLAVADVDTGEAAFQAPVSLNGTYGTFTFDTTTGAWTYALDNSRPATQALTAGQQVHETLTVTSADGTASQIIDVTVTGANDSAVIGGTAIGSVTEAGGISNGSAGSPTASGALTIGDVDAGQAAFQTPASLNGTYGTFTFNAATGAWTYALDNTRPATQALNAGQAVHDTLTVQSLDGSATQVIDVTVNGADDSASIGGTATGAVTEAGGVNNGTAGTPTATGTLTITDVDAGQAGFQAPSAGSLNGTYGTFTFNAATGVWTYALDNTRGATQALNAGQQAHDTLTITSTDGSASRLIDVTVNGSNDNAAISGTASGSVVEASGVNNGAAGVPSASGTLTVADVDAGQAAFQVPASLNGTYGSFAFNPATGAWTYTLDDSRAATQALNEGDTAHETLTVQSIDGTATQVIDIVIKGENDFASISGTTTGSVTEAGGINNGSAGSPTATGTLIANDVDAGQAAFQAPTSLAGTYGSFTFNAATGAWTYTLDNTRPATQSLIAGQQANDSLIVQSLDGTAAQLINVTIIGSNDNASIAGTATGSVTEAGGLNNGSAGAPAASGTLTVADVDNGETSFQAPTPSSLNGVYGSFSFNNATGAWTYTLDNTRSATQQLTAGQQVHETLTVTSLDGSATQVIDVTVTGSNDTAVITGTAASNVVEAGGISNGTAGTPTASGTLSVADADAGQSGFQAPSAGSLNGTYGTFTFNTATGAWTYALDNTRAATQQLAAGQQVHDTLTITSSDGSASQLIDVTVNGSNDAAAISGTATGTVVESGSTSGTPTATGTLTVADVDAGQAGFQTPSAGSLNGTYGSFTFNTATGVWAYTLDNTRPATQQLTAGQTVHDTLTVTSTDGSATRVIDVTVSGADDNAVIGGTTTGAVTEAGGLNNGSAGTPGATGTLTIADPDAGQAGFQTPSAGSLNGTYGSFTFNAATGAWTYTLDNTRSATQQLIAGQQAHDTLTITSTDGSATQVIDVTVNGSNDNATITGTATGSVTEAGGLNNAAAGAPNASGSLSVADVDAGQAAFQAPASLAGTYGSFTFNASTGAWTYTLDNTRPATQALIAGQQMHDTLSVQSLDGTASQIIDVTVTGSNDTAVIAGTTIGSVTEAGGVNNGSAGTPSANGTLTVADADAGQAGFQTPASLNGTYGSFTFNAATGAWTYTLDNTRSATQALTAGQQVHDTLTIASTDGSATQVIDVTVNGSNDNATISGTATGSVTEAGGLNNASTGTPTASGTLTVTDVDNAQAAFQAPASLAGTYGTFTFNASTGAWTYALDNTRSATQQLTAGQQVHDTLTVQSLDGTASRVIDVTVTGANDSAVIGGTTTGAVTEAGGVNNGNAGTPTATGTLTVTDVDNAQAGFQPPGNLNGTYGQFAFNAATGTWTYTLDNSRAATQSLTASDTVHETLTVQSLDGGTTQVIDVTVTGSNDNATITGTATGNVVEAGGISNASAGTPTASGTLSVTDVDNAQAVFQTPASLAGTYGTFSFNASTGAWTYTLDNTRAATQQLTAGQQVHDTLTVSSADGTASQIIDVTVTGSNDTAVIGGTATGAVTEAGGVSNGSAGAPTATGTLTVTDVDAGQAGFQTPSAASLNGTYGTFTFSAASGTWTYTLDNTRAATQALNVGQQAHDTLTIASTDGSATRVIDVTVNGANDNATIGGTAIGAVTEAGGVNNGSAGAPTANGTLSVSDVDNTGFATPSSLAGTYGSFTFNTATGAWTYTLDNTRAATQALTAGQQVHDTLTVSSADGTASQIVDVTVTGANDSASISGTATGTVTEAGGVGNGTAGTPTASGTLSVSDVDNTGFATPSSLAGTYGSFTFNTATGTWTYTLDDTRAATQALIAGQQAHDTLTVTSADGTATRVIDVTVTGANDTATITGTATGSVTEAGGINNGIAGTPTASGALSVSDVDSAQAVFQAPASLAGTYGTFTFNASTGAWTYTLDNTRSATQQLIANQQVHDTLTVQSLDGTASQIIDVTVTGSNDTAVIAGTTTGSVTEDVAVNGSGNIATGGTLTVSDADSGQSSFQAGTTAGTYGSFVLAANGAWTYTASNSNAAVQALGSGQTLTENFTVRSADGTSSTVTVTINGTNDAAVITPATVNLTETNAVLSTGGTLSITDIDSPATFVPQSSVAGSNGYGQFTLASNGAWTYVTNTAHNEFVAGTTYTDTLTVTSADGTTSTITVRILGTNDAATITGTSTGSVTEDGTLTTTGTLNATDLDSAATFTAASATGTYGNFSINAAGVWTYTLRNGDANVQALTSAQHPTETFTVTTADGSSQVITITVNGANEAPTATITAANGNEDTSIPITLTGSDVDGSIASFTVTVLPANGTLYYGGSPVAVGSSIPATAGSAALSFVPSANWNGATSLSFRATDAEGGSSTVVSQGITVNAVNDAPVNTVPATQTTAEDTPRAITGLSINDVDAGSGSMTVTLAVTNGTLTVSGGSAAIANSGTGSVTLTGTMAQINATLASNVTYVPTANFNGTASLTMTTNDGGNTGTGGALSDVDVITINVTAVNDAPVAVADARSTSEDTPLTMTAASLLANDTDVEGNTLSIVSVQSPTNGTVSIVGGNVVFTPTANYSGPASFTYTASDGNGGTSTGTVTVNVTAVADAPALTIGAAPSGGGSFTPPASSGLTQQFYDNVATVGSSNAGNIATVETNIEATTPTSSTITTGSVDVASIGTDDAYRYTGYIYLAAGSTYTVTGSRDDTLMVKLGGSSVYSVGFNNFGNFTATTFTPTVSGYYSLEIIAYNGDGVGNLDLNISVNGGAARDLSSANFSLYANSASVLASGTVTGGQVVNGDGGYYAAGATGTANEAIALNPITATLRDTDGSESLAVSISAIPVGAILSDGTNSFTASAGSTSTSVTGWNLATLTLTPPASAAGNYAMTVTAVATDTGGVTATTTDTISVQVNPAADTPALNIPNAVIAVGQGSGASYTVDLPIMAALRDTDGSETLTVQVSGLPSGATLNHGTSSGGVWTVASSDLSDLTLTLPAGYSNDAVNGTTLTITAVATEATGGDTATTSSTLTLFADYTTTSTTSNSASTTGTGADDYIVGGNSANTLTGGDGNDLIYGRNGNDTLNGGNGNDVLFGEAGNDAIVGGAGRDRIVGGAGNDTLTGGTGSGPDNMTDVFVWNLADKGTTTTPATDTITDFDNTTGRGDTLDLRDLLQGETYAMSGASGSYNGNLDHYLHFTYSGGNTTIQVSSAGAFAGNGVVNGSVAANTIDQTIVLQGVNLTSGFTTDTQIINDLLTRGKLITDNG